MMNAQAPMKATKPLTAYFFLGKDQNGHFHGYPHEAIVLAEGLKHLGWQIASDVTAWSPSPGSPMLFPGSEASLEPKDCDLLVVADDFFMLQGSPELPAELVKSSVPAIFLDRRDLGTNIRDLHSKPYQRFQKIFRTHGNERFRYPKNVRHMVFGLSDRIARASEHAAHQTRNVSREGLIWNFRHKQFPHTVRTWAENKVRPIFNNRTKVLSEVDPEVEGNQYSTLMLNQTEGRHFPAYYSRMANAEMAACFGGWFLLPVPQREAGYLCMFGRRVLKFMQQPSSMIAQWDSWRMWEAFAAGTTVLHVNMSDNGFLFGGPRPEPMKHYIAVNLNRPADDLIPLLEDAQRIRSIGESGRDWAIENYSSKPIARRILADIGL